MHSTDCSVALRFHLNIGSLTGHRDSHNGHRPAHCLCSGVHSCANAGVSTAVQKCSSAQTGKSIIQLLLWGHKMTSNGL